MLFLFIFTYLFSYFFFLYPARYYFLLGAVIFNTLLNLMSYYKYYCNISLEVLIKLINIHYIIFIFPWNFSNELEVRGLWMFFKSVLLGFKLIYIPFIGNPKFNYCCLLFIVQTFNKWYLKTWTKLS